MSTEFAADGGVIVTHQNGAVEYGPPVNGTYYHRDTPRRVIDVLERARRDRFRIRLHYGDVVTGRDWMDEHWVTGRVGRSMGKISIPLILANSRSPGGPSILDHCIVQIRTAKSPRHILYQHPKYHYGDLDFRPCDMEGYTHEVTIDGDVHARFRSLESCIRWMHLFT